MTAGRPSPSLRSILVLSFVVALALRGLVAAWTYALYPDGAVELWMAEALLHGRVAEALATRFHPLNATLTALVSGLTGLGVERAATLVAVVGSSLAAPLCAAVAARLTPASPRRAALAGGLLAAAHPSLTRLGGQVMAYGVAHAALALALACLAIAVQQEARGSAARWAAAGGAAVGLGYLARMDGLATGAGLGLGLALSCLHARRWRPPLAFLAGLLLAMSPFVIALRVTTGTWQLSTKKAVGSVLALPGPSAGMSAGAPTAPSKQAPSLADLIRREAGAPPRTTPTAHSGSLARASAFALEKALGAAHPWLVVLAGLGLLLAAARGPRPPPGWALSLLAAAAFVGVHALLQLNWGYTSRLHQSALGVLVVPWAARGLVHLTARRPRGTALLLAASLGLLIPKALAPRLRHKRLQRRAAALLRAAADAERLPEPRTVCGTGEVRPVAWRAGFTFAELPPGPYPEALAAARRAGITYLVVYLRRRGRRPGALERTLAQEGVRPLGPPLVSQRGEITYTWILFRL